jgi:hypothetical protein
MEEEMMLEEESLMSPLDPQIKLLLLKNQDKYLIGRVTELDEEPSILIENCCEIVECAEYGSDPEDIKKRAHSLEGTHLKVSARKIDEGEKDYYVYEYIILRPYPKFSAQRDLFLTSETIFTILDPEPGVLDLYQKVAG